MHLRRFVLVLGRLVLGKLVLGRLVLGLLLTVPAAALAADKPTAPSLDGFDDGIKHWQSTHGQDYPRYAPEQVAQIADNLLRYQHADGGWPVNQDPARILDQAERARLLGEQSRNGGSFDNRNSYTQVQYLAAAQARTGDARYRAAAVRGLDFILAQQLPGCGGWPHSVPARESYHGLITFADEVTPGVLSALRQTGSVDGARGQGDFAFVDAAQRQRIDAAVARGDDCVLRLQVRQDGIATAWAGQYDPATLQPVRGRRFELPSIVVDESVSTVRYLMSIPVPSPQVVAAVDAAVAWLRRVQLHGQRLETVQATAEQYRYHSSTSDRRLVADPAAPPLWARFYDLADNTVVLANREGERVASYDQIPRERRTGYNWYGTWPQSLLERDYPRWQQRLAQRKP
ncbi:pectate lyase [Lysobacter cavernae]|uniref:Pectate lyase n=1 Tax=Lysobacter cavernae TaxID=1685901 RepID=A0ABV7RLP6_9GAMM